MPTSDTPFNEKLEYLHRLRDELGLQIHLGAEDIREEWEHAEVRWARLQGEVKRLAEASKRPSKKLKSAAVALAHEVGISYTRIQSALQRPA